MFGKTRAGKLNDSRGVIVFKKLSFENVFRSHEHEKPGFLNSSDLKSIFEKLRDGLVWTASLSNRRNKAAFSNFSTLPDSTRDLSLQDQFFYSAR